MPKGPTGAWNEVVLGAVHTHIRSNLRAEYEQTRQNGRRNRGTEISRASYRSYRVSTMS